MPSEGFQISNFVVSQSHHENGVTLAQNTLKGILPLHMNGWYQGSKSHGKKILDICLYLIIKRELYYLLYDHTKNSYENELLFKILWSVTMATL